MIQPEKIELLPQRILSRIEKIPESGCWIWMGALRTGGYAHVSWGGKLVAVHRLLYEIEHGVIPAGLVSDHLCRVRSCVNPYHIELVSSRINILRGVGPAAKLAARSCCGHGHEFSEHNTYVVHESSRANPRRKCRACDLARGKKYYRNKMAKLGRLVIERTQEIPSVIRSTAKFHVMRKVSVAL